MSALQELLKDTFGYDDFRPGQETIIRHVLRQENVLGIMPTGGGKSICYQLPALLLDNLTLVISPLISLMKDQVDALNLMGIRLHISIVPFLSRNESSYSISG